MPQLNGGGGDELGANDEMISFKDEGEQEEKISEDVSAERDLDDVKSSLVNESENNSSSSDSEVSRTQPHAVKTHGCGRRRRKITFLLCFSPFRACFLSKPKGAVNRELIMKVMRKPESILLKVRACSS